MTSPIYQARYISTQTSPDVANDLPAILDTSRKRNQAVGVTGLLVYNGERFLQFLEGPMDAVLSTIERIKHDPRHSGLIIIGTGSANERAFGEWDMAYQMLTAHGPALETQVQKLVDGAPEEVAREFISYVRLKPEHRAA